MKIYGAFEKVEPQDDGTIKVWGIASSESVDGEGEVIKASAMKAAWPEYMEFANVREMHGKIAAGTVFESSISDDGKTHIGVHVVDAGSVKKVQTSVLKGFSIGGNITARDELDKSIVTGIKLTEISLVDRPCNPDARITLWKAEGIEPPDEIVDQFIKTMAVIVDSGFTQEQILAKVAAREDVNPSSGTDKYGDVKFADEKNKKYPIDTEAHIRAAWNYINKEKNGAKYSSGDLSTIKGKIVAAWKAKIDKDGPPSADKAADALTLRKMDCEARAALLIDNPKAQTVLKSLSIMAGDKLEKGLWTVSSLACLIGNLFDLQQGCESEAAYEGDGSVLPDELADAVKTLGEILQHMVAEEIEELYPADGEDMDVDVLEMAAKIETLAKRGAQHSAATMGHLQAMHDTLQKMTGGKVCEGTDKAIIAAELQKAANVSAAQSISAVATALHIKDGDDIVKGAETLHKVLHETQTALANITAEREELKKLLTEAQTTMAESVAEIEKLKKEPEPGGPLRPGLHLVTKADETKEPGAEPAEPTPTVRGEIRKVIAAGGKPYTGQL